MAWEAKGKLIGFKTKRGGPLDKFGKITDISVLEAVMHEGWLGANHKVQLKFDKKFTDDMAVNIGIIGDYKHGITHMASKRIEDCEIIIIIR